MCEDMKGIEYYMSWPGETIKKEETDRICSILKQHEVIITSRQDVLCRTWLRSCIQY